MAMTTHDTPKVGHPLDPLTADEVSRVASILRTRPGLGHRVRFNTITLREPTRQELRLFRQHGALERLAEIVLLDNDTGLTSEAIVSLSRRAIWPLVYPAAASRSSSHCRGVSRGSG